jgi:hypothetical protein
MAISKLIMVILLIGSFFNATIASADDVKIITNITAWNHPVINILQKNKIVLYKVELHNKNYAIFYVKFPYDPRFAHNDNFFKPLYYETLKANGFWDYAFIDRSFDCRIKVTWDKKSKTLSEDLKDLK